MPHRSDNQVVEDANFKAGHGLFETLGEHLVGAGRFWIARRMIVHQNQRRRVMRQRTLHNFARVDRRTIEAVRRALVQPLLS